MSVTYKHVRKRGDCIPTFDSKAPKVPIGEKPLLQPLPIVYVVSLYKIE
jgi:hypothetical protein